ncbi:MAG: hypothetical protein GEV28_12795 [Actinophytocola sp.]|uniref:hypothetical protein n=1 Tax=Actinophytocola sp. TaxID=1872138 RepID=UPI0013292B91|nr:hypothetical protein [Actinophytocola sp.]MPZ81217.1 hypothetical protein [Actinophytocola sp.]
MKHEDGSLELITLYVAHRADKSAELIDATGATYAGGLDDFRENNDLLGSDDLILAPREITAVPGEGAIVTVSGHTAATWYWWLIGVVAVVLVLGTGLVAVRRVRSRAAPAAGDLPAAGTADSDLDRPPAADDQYRGLTRSSRASATSTIASGVGRRGRHYRTSS